MRDNTFVQLLVAVVIVLAVGLVARCARPAMADECPCDPYQGDTGFSSGDLTGDLAVWHGRTLASTEDGNNWATILADAQDGDPYNIGRGINLVVSGYLHAFRATGDFALLDSCVALTDVTRDSLQDAWWDGTTDGYDGWLWDADGACTADPVGGAGGACGTYGGKDIHWDEFMAYAAIAEMAWTLSVNAGVDTVYANRASFWRDHLWNDFQAKWLARDSAADPLNPTDAELESVWTSLWTSNPASSGLYRDFWHPASASMRMAYFFHRLYGRSFYRDEFERLRTLWLADLQETGSPARYYWTHEVGGGAEGVQKMTYVRYTWASISPLVDLGAGVGTGSKFAAAFAHVFSQGTTAQMGERIDGTDGPISLSPAGAGSAAQYGSYTSIMSACAAVYDVTQSSSIHVCGFATRGANP